MRATLSILGLYNYDDTIFDNMKIPSGMTAKKSVLVKNLLAELAEFEILYTDPEMMKFMIATWSEKELPVWEKEYATLSLEYNPLENYDRMEDWTDNTASTTRTRLETRDNGNSTIDTDMTDESITQVAGYNGEGWTNRDKTNETNNQATRTNTVQNGTNIGDGSGTHDAEHTGRIHGNIGVVTAQQMLEQERKVVEFNMMDYIINSFKKRFCLAIY